MKQQLKQMLANPWLRRYILVGYAAKGTIYLSIGILVIQSVFNSPFQAPGTYRTLIFLAYPPLGKVLVCLLAIGLWGYVLRRFSQLILFPANDNPWRLKGIFQRLGYLMSGLSYAGISYSALNIVFELGEYDDTIEDLVNELFEQPIGEWLILLGGIIISLVGFSYIYGAYTGSYISDFQSDNMPRKLKKWAIYVGKVGVSSRGIAFILTAIFVMQAAISGHSELAGGLQNALRELATKPLGWLWLELIGGGLICYGLYMFVATIYRRYAIK